MDERVPRSSPWIPIPCYLARLLHLSPGVLLLVVTGTMYNGHGSTAEYAFATFGGDRSLAEIQAVPETD
jgi:hypothetical protein